MMNPRTGLILTALAAALLVQAAGATDFEEKRFYVTPFVGWTFFDNERLFQSGRNLNDDVYFGGRAGMRLTDLLWFDLAGGYTGTKDCAVNLIGSAQAGNVYWQIGTSAQRRGDPRHERLDLAPGSYGSPAALSQGRQGSGSPNRG